MKSIHDRAQDQVVSLSEDEKRRLVQRVMNGVAFSSSPTLRAFLSYVAERTLAQDFDGLKEQQIGAQVLGRRPDYDPAEDNIVRVRAGRLRQKLEEYFTGEGRYEPFVMSIPKGHYVSVFEARSHSPEARLPADAQNATGNVTTFKEHALAVATSDENSTEAPVADSRVRRPGTSRIIAFVTVLLIVVVFYVLLQLKKIGPFASGQDSNSAEANQGLWREFFPARGQELVIVTADSGAALWQDITHRNLSLGDYVSRKYLQQDQFSSTEMREIATRRYTSPIDLTVSLRLAEIARLFGGHVKADFARNIDIHDLRAGNIVLLGSRRSNPWVELFETQMNFVLDVNSSVEGPCFRNRSPKPGEPSIVTIAGTYLVVQGAENKAVDSYAVAALLPSASGRGKVLILEGLNMEGTEAAAEFVINRDRFSTFLHKIGLKKDATLKSFEVLLKLTSLGGGYANPEIVAYRYGG